MTIIFFVKFSVCKYVILHNWSDYLCFRIGSDGTSVNICAEVKWLSDSVNSMFL